MTSPIGLSRYQLPSEDYQQKKHPTSQEPVIQSGRSSPTLDRYLNRLKELPLTQTHIANDETFRTNESVTEEDWQSAIKALQKVLTEWIKALEECSEEKLLSSAYKEPIESWSSVISNLTIHNAYHIGQIVEIRKMYGLWDPKNGVH